jgi:hypothetical protein
MRDARKTGSPIVPSPPATLEARHRLLDHRQLRRELLRMLQRDGRATFCPHAIVTFAMRLQLFDSAVVSGFSRTSSA